MEIAWIAQPLRRGRHVSFLGRLWRCHQRVGFHVHRRFSTHVEHKTLTSGGFAAHLSFEGDKKYPTLHPLAIARLTDELTSLNNQDAIKALFLRSTIAGADVDYMEGLKTPSEAIAFIRSVDKLCSSVQDFRVPVIAIIDGPCMGAGMELAASCDTRIAVQDEKTIFAMPETKIGIPSVVQASLLPGIIGWGRARQLLYFGQQFTAADAFQTGFVNQVTSREGLAQVLTQWEKWVDEAEINAVIAQKALMRTWEREGTDRAGIEASIRVFGNSFKADIPQQRMAAFSSKLKTRKQ